MKQRIRIACFILGLAILGGSLVYGCVIAMERLADALSLSPALKNLAPLAGLAVFWFISSRCLKYFQGRKQHRTVPGSDTASPPLPNKDEERRQAWLQIRAKGRKRYIWRTGIVGWGLPVFAIFTPTMLIFGPRTHQLSTAEIVGGTVFSFFLWMLGGYFFGRSMWKFFDSKYR